MRHTLTVLSLLALSTAPLAAQHDMHMADPDRKVRGGTLPAGWTGRTDRDGARLADARFQTMGTGFHVTSGPAAIYWSEKIHAHGPFTATATFTQMKAPTHPEAYGIFFMGKNLTAANQDYGYLLVRGDGKYMVKHRAGKDVHTIVDWTESSAVHKADANGKATNTLRAEGRADGVHLFVNGTEVATMPAAKGDVSGQVGLRVNHNLDVHIADFAVTPTK